MARKQVSRVVLADDNDMTRALLRGILRGDDHYEVVGEASNGEQAAEMILRLKPDAVCLDVMMPKSDGLEVLRQIKAELPLTVVIMVTGSMERDTVQAAIAGGASGYIVKPFNSAKVLDTIAAALQKVRGTGSRTA